MIIRMRHFLSLVVCFSCLPVLAQTTQFVIIEKSINTPQQEWTLNSVYAKPFYTVFTWTVQCKDMTASVYMPENVYIEDLDTHIRYGLARKPKAINPSTFNQCIKYELTFKGIPNTVRALKLVAPTFTMNDIIINDRNRIVSQTPKNETVSVSPTVEETPMIHEIKQPIVSDVDIDIPIVKEKQKNTFALIIANENYQEVAKVPNALNDGKIFAEYCSKTLGLPQNNIKLVADATFNNIRRQLNWLKQVMEAYQGEASVIVYYAGHGIPDESNGSSHLLPVDGIGNDASTGYSLEHLYSELSSKPAKSVLVLLDACFSGAMRDGGMLASARGVAIKAKQNAPKGNLVVLSAAHGDETAYPYTEKGHGLFTYYLLKKIQETKGNVTFGKLAEYVTSEVKKQSIVSNGKMQTPTVIPSQALMNSWQNMKLK